MKKTLGRKSKASHSFCFIFTKYFLCNVSYEFGLETHFPCLALFWLYMQIDLYSATTEKGI